MSIDGRLSWSPQKVEELERLLVEGLSCSHIAARLNVTRNAVIGKIYRMGLGRLRPATAIRHTSRPSGRRDSRVSPYRRYIRKQPAPRKTAEPEPSFKGISFAQLTAGTCRWPSVERINGCWTYCGCEVIPGTPYCAYHNRVGVVMISDKSSDIVKRMQRELPK